MDICVSRHHGGVYIDAALSDDKDLQVGGARRKRTLYVAELRDVFFEAVLQPYDIKQFRARRFNYAVLTPHRYSVFVLLFVLRIKRRENDFHFEYFVLYVGTLYRRVRVDSAARQVGRAHRFFGKHAAHKNVRQHLRYGRHRPRRNA